MNRHEYTVVVCYAYPASKTALLVHKTCDRHWYDNPMLKPQRNVTINNMNSTRTKLVATTFIEVTGLSQV